MSRAVERWRSSYEPWRAEQRYRCINKQANIESWDSRSTRNTEALRSVSTFRHYDFIASLDEAHVLFSDIHQPSFLPASAEGLEIGRSVVPSSPVRTLSLTSEEDRGYSKSEWERILDWQPRKEVSLEVCRIVTLWYFVSS